MKSPWKTMQPLRADRDYFVFASSIPPRSYRSTPRLFSGARAVRKQLETASGIVGFSLLAQPVAKQYGTLSMWDDEASLRAFAAEEPHRSLMAQLAAEMGETRFVWWTSPGSAGRPSWGEALRRLG